jgi:hypothetical protein
MRRTMRFILLAALLLFISRSAQAMQNAQGWCESGNIPVVTSGLTSTTKVQASYPQCTVTVFIHGGGLATIYADNASTPLANPFTAQSNGRWIFYTTDGGYDVQLSGAGFPSAVTYSDIILGTEIAVTMDTILQGLAFQKNTFNSGQVSIFNGNFETGVPFGSAADTGILPSPAWGIAPGQSGIPGWVWGQAPGDLSCITPTYETTTQYPNKSRSLKQVFNGCATGAEATNVTSYWQVQPGDTYYIQASMKTNGTTGYTCIRFLDKTNTGAPGVFPSDSSICATTTSATWVTVSATGTVPANMVYAKLGLPFPISNPAGTVWYDNIQVFRVSNPGGVITPSVTDSGLTSGNCVQASTGGLLTTISGGCSAGGTVTSVSDAGFAPLFTTNVATPTTTPAITNTAISQNANTFLAGPSGTATDIVDFSIPTATGTASPISISATPHQSGDLAIVVSVRDGAGNAPNFTPDVSWTAGIYNNATQRYFYKNVSGLTPATASGAIGTTNPNWSAALVLLTAKAGFTPVVTNDSGLQNGAWSSFTNLPISFTPTAGRTLVAVIMSGQTIFSACPGPVAVATFTDSAGDVFVPLTYVVNNAGQGTQLTVLAATNIAGGATTFNNTMAYATASFPLTCSLANGFAAIFEVTNLAPINPLIAPPIFRNTVGADIPFASPVSLGGILSKASVTNKFVTSINTDGTVSQAQPSFSNLSGVATGAQLPATTSNCTGNNFAQGLNAGFTPICAAPTALTAIQAYTTKNLAGNVTVNANTLTLIDSMVITFPSSGGPWRAFLAYDYYFNGGVNGECYLTDGTTLQMLVESQPLNNSSSCQMGALSKATYANGAVITFSVYTYDTGATTVNASGGRNVVVPSYMQVGVLASN